MSEFMDRTDIPVDGDPHEVPYYPVHVTEHPDDYSILRVWSLAADDSDRKTLLQVFDEHQTVPDGAVYFRTVVAAQGTLAWHVFDVTEVGQNNDS